MESPLTLMIEDGYSQRHSINYSPSVVYSEARKYVDISVNSSPQTPSFAGGVCNPANVSVNK